jgi:hypothetical protein
MAATDRPRNRRAPRALLALVATALLAGDASAQMQIDEIVITSGPAYAGGSFTNFFIDPVVFGSGIASVTISSQSGTLNATLVEVTPGEFVCDEAIPTEPCENFPSLAAISALGAITFDFLGDQGETDSETIPLADYDPGSGQPGFPDVTFPANGQTDVASNATLTWTSPPSWVEALAVGIENLATGLTPDEDLFFGAPVTTTSWAPAGMSSGNAYDFEISFFEPLFFEDPRTTNGSRAYLYTSAFESFNSVVFFVPEPGVTISLVAGSLLLGGLARRRRAR